MRRSDLVLRVGSRLRELRQLADLTQEEVEERAGFSGKYVSEIERGLRDPPLTTLEKLARGIGCEVSDVFAPLRANPSRAIARPGPKQTEWDRRLANLSPRRRDRVAKVWREVATLAIGTSKPKG